MAPRTDKLYQVDTIPDDFDFNERVVEVFDDMLDRSIPFYQEVIKATAALLARHLVEGDSVCDLGCSTGTSLLQLARLLKDKKLVFTGIDSSPSMLEKAKLKTEMYAQQDRIVFSREDITELTRPGTGAFVINYTLQFIRPLLRPALVNRLYNNLRPGGLVILSEKTILPDKWLNRSYIEIYHQFKKARGYSELEIAKKREALENILIPFSIEENVMLLQNGGFVSVAPFFQWFNFSSFVAFKPA